MRIPLLLGGGEVKTRYLSPLETMMYAHLATRVVVVYTLYGEVDTEPLEKAFQAALAPHLTLQGRVAKDGDRYRLGSGQGGPPRLRVRDNADDAFHRELNTPLKPGGDLVRAVLLRGGGPEHTLMLQLNHAFSDGRSALALGEALWRNYCALGDGTPLAANEEIRCPDPVETRLQRWSDAEVADFTAQQAKLSKLRTLAILPATADVPAPDGAARDPGRRPKLDVQRLLLDRGDTEGVFTVAKETGVSVHGLISGALLSQLRPHLRPATGPVWAGCMSAVDLRSRLDPPIPDSDMILGASWFTGMVELTEDSDPIEIGRDYLDQLREGVDRADPELSLRAIPHLTGDAGVLRANLSVSNLQAASLPPTPPGLDLTDIRVFGAPDRNFEKADDGRLRVTVLTVDGRMGLDIAYDSGFFRPSQIRDFLDATGALLRSYSTDIEDYPMPRAEGCPFDPPPQLRRGQGEPSLRRVRLWDGSTPWLVTGYAEQRAVLADPRVSADANRPGYPLPAGLFRAPGMRRRSLITMDPPEHLDLRRLLAKEFSVRRAESLRPRFQEVADGLVAALLAGLTPVDLVRAFAQPVAASMICELLGVPRADQEFFEQQSSVLVTRRASPEEADAARATLRRYVDELVAGKQRRPGSDLLSRLIVEHVNTGALTREDVVDAGLLFLAGGHETTTSMIGLGTVALLSHPEELAKLRQVEDLRTIDRAVNELLRYLNVTHTGQRRVALADLEIGGQLIRAGEGVIAHGPAGNRDERVFPDPDRLDLSRDATHHIAFGFGGHRCIGGAMAKVQLQVVYGTLYRRIPTLRLAIPFDQVAFKHDMLIYGVHELPVAW